MKSFQKKIHNFIPLLFLTAIFLLSSCNSTTKNDSDEAEKNPAGQTITPEKNPAQGEDVALNPPHGQPGHRCDIKVGEPLKSSPNTSNTTTNGQTPLLLEKGAAPANGLNPAHGQPGHRCDIKVGDPL